jgi:hypothetical protein
MRTWLKGQEDRAGVRVRPVALLSGRLALAPAATRPAVRGLLAAPVAAPVIMGLAAGPAVVVAVPVAPVRLGQTALRLVRGRDAIPGSPRPGARLPRAIRLATMLRAPIVRNGQNVRNAPSGRSARNGQNAGLVRSSGLALAPRGQLGHVRLGHGQPVARVRRVAQTVVVPLAVVLPVIATPLVAVPLVAVPAGATMSRIAANAPRVPTAGPRVHVPGRADPTMLCGQRVPRHRGVPLRLGVLLRPAGRRAPIGPALDGSARIDLTGDAQLRAVPRPRSVAIAPASALVSPQVMASRCAMLTVRHMAGRPLDPPLIVPPPIALLPIAVPPVALPETEPQETAGRHARNATALRRETVSGDRGLVTGTAPPGMLVLVPAGRAAAHPVAAGALVRRGPVVRGQAHRAAVARVPRAAQPVPGRHRAVREVRGHLETQMADATPDPVTLEHVTLEHVTLEHVTLEHGAPDPVTMNGAMRKGASPAIALHGWTGRPCPARPCPTPLAPTSWTRSPVAS